MDRVWQWAWDRYGSRYSWAVLVLAFLVSLPAYLLWSTLIVAVEKSSRYGEAVAATVVAALALSCLGILLDRSFHPAERWAAGDAVDPVAAVEATYTFTRNAVRRALYNVAVCYGLSSIIVGAVAGASRSRLVQYGFLGAAIGIGVQLIAMHSMSEAAARPARVAIAGDTRIGDSFPRSRPTFAAWSSVTFLSTIFVFSVDAAMLGSAFAQASVEPVLFLAIGCALTAGFGLPITLGVAFAPSLRPIGELAAATERVAAGNYRQRVPVVQDDDLGVLAASFNRMQAGVAERQRLHAAFGTYVDPTLAARLLDQGDDVFTGERREVTVMFIDIRDFTPFAEANTAEDTVARLNALFEIVVPVVVDASGHVNKFLGDGALAVFGAPNDLANHADAAARAAVLIHRRVAERFGRELQIGIGINTGAVIAGTIGGGSKLEFTLIGDTVNVAARVEQLTKVTGDAILFTEQCVSAIASRLPGLTDRGLHVLKGKSDAVHIFGVDHESIDPTN